MEKKLGDRREGWEGKGKKKDALRYTTYMYQPHRRNTSIAYSKQVLIKIKIIQKQ